MTKYNGYYIDHVCFNSKADIDKFRKEQAVIAFKRSVELFVQHPCLERSKYETQKAMILVKEYGFTYGEVEDMEIQVMASMH